MITSIIATTVSLLMTMLFGWLWYRCRSKNCTVNKIAMFIFGAVLVLSVPFLINELYKWGNVTGRGYNSSWGAKEVLAFYGSFLAFIGTVALGALALWQNFAFDKRSRLEKKLSIRPYLFTTIEDENTSFLAENDVGYYDLEVCDEVITVKGFKRNKPHELSKYLKVKEQYDKLLDTDEKFHEKQMELLTKQTEILNAFNNRHTLVAYKIANYGNAAAININVRLNNEIFTPRFSMSKDSSTIFYLLCDFKAFSIGKKSFTFEFKYYDIENFGPYTQTEVFHIDKLKEGTLQLNFSEQISEPK